MEKYGDIEKKEKDKKVLIDILERQGYGFIFDMVADYIANVAKKFRLSDYEKERIKSSIFETITRHWRPKNEKICYNQD